MAFRREMEDLARAKFGGMPPRVSRILDVVTCFEPGDYVRFVAREPRYGWDVTRCFSAIRADGWEDYYAIGPDGQWWCGGTNLPAVLGWDIESLARRAGV